MRVREEGYTCVQVGVQGRNERFLFFLPFLSPPLSSLMFTSLQDRASVGSDSRPDVSALLGDGSQDGTSLHLALVVDDDAGVVLKVDEETFSSPPGLSLSDDDGGQHLLSKLGLSLLAGGHDHVTNASRRKSVESTLVAHNGDDVQVLGTRVIGTVDQSTDGKTHGDSELVAGGTASTSFGHVLIYSLGNEK